MTAVGRLAMILVAALFSGCTQTSDRAAAERFYSDGETARKARNWPAALKAYDAAIRADPRWAEPHYQRGWIYNELNQPGVVVYEMSAAIRLSPGWDAPYIERAFAYNQSRQHREAIQDLDRAITLSPGRAEPYAERCFAHRRLLELQLARIDWDAAVRLGPGNVTALVNRGELRLQLKDWDGAIRDFNKALVAQPDDKRLQVKLAAGKAAARTS